MNTIPVGAYSLQYKNGEHRTIKVSAGKGKFEDKLIVAFREGTNYIGFGFLNADNTVIYWKKFKEVSDATRIKRIDAAIAAIAGNQPKASQVFAMKEGRCSRCGKTLTVPASLHAGLGPECAKERPWVVPEEPKLVSAATSELDNDDEY